MPCAGCGDTPAVLISFEFFAVPDFVPNREQKLKHPFGSGQTSASFSYMPILAICGAWPDAEQWVRTDVTSLQRIRNWFAEQLQSANNDENTRMFNASVQAVLSSHAGDEVWF